MHKLTENETILPDNYTIYSGYLYIVDNQIIRSQVITTVKELKKHLSAKEVRKCDLTGHIFAKVGDFVYGELWNI